MEQIYKIDERTIRLKKRLLLFMLGFLLPATLILTSIYIKTSSNDSWVQTIITFVLSLVLLESMCIFVAKKIIKNFEELNLIITEDHIERISGASVEKIPFNTVTKFKTGKNREGRVITVHIDTHNASMVLSGFNDMDGISNTLGQHIPKASTSSKGIQGINWSEPTIIAIIVVYIVLAILSLLRLGSQVYMVIDYFIMLTLGACGYIFKPLSKNAGARFVKFERFLSWGMMVPGVLLIIGKLFLPGE